MVKEKQQNTTPSFLLPRKVIKFRNFSKKDVFNIKNNLMKSLSMVYLIAGIAMIIIFSILTAAMTITTNNGMIEKYGLFAFIGLISSNAGAIATVTLIILSFLAKDKKKSLVLLRIGADLLYISIASYMLMAIYSDAEKGFTTHDVSVSASIILCAILALIQPIHWRDATILDLLTTIGLIAVSLFATIFYDMKGIHYYLIIALVFPLVCYMVVTLLFYTESQRYIELLENERLHNHAFYDSLTHCKNRYSLSDFIKENSSRWSNGGTNLLIALFDIDDFHLYNSQFSHLGGDYCLSRICEEVRKEFTSPNLDFFRYGGEEFLLFFELNNPDDAIIYLKRIRDAIDRLDIAAPKGAPKEKVTISLGGHLFNIKKSFNFEDEMKVVDEYLFKAKGSGKDAICYNGSIINN